MQLNNFVTGFKLEYFSANFKTDFHFPLMVLGRLLDYRTMKACTKLWCKSEMASGYEFLQVCTQHPHVDNGLGTTRIWSHLCTNLQCTTFYALGINHGMRFIILWYNIMWHWQPLYFTLTNMGKFHYTVATSYFVDSLCPCTLISANLCTVFD